MTIPLPYRALLALLWNWCHWWPLIIWRLSGVYLDSLESLGAIETVFCADPLEGQRVWIRNSCLEVLKWKVGLNRYLILRYLISVFPKHHVLYVLRDLALSSAGVLAASLLGVSLGSWCDIGSGLYESYAPFVDMCESSPHEFNFQSVKSLSLGTGTHSNFPVPSAHPPINSTSDEWTRIFIVFETTTLQPNSIRGGQESTRPYLYSQLILRATPSAAGPCWLLGVAIWGAWCFRFDILGDHFSTSGAPWEPFWHLGTALKDHGSARMDTRWSRTGFSLILKWFWDLCIFVFWIQEARNFIFFGLVSRSLF